VPRGTPYVRELRLALKARLLLRAALSGGETGSHVGQLRLVRRPQASAVPSLDRNEGAMAMIRRRG
jgi:hypothetical protein